MVWGIVCVLAVIAVALAAEQCRDAIIRSDSCSGFQRFAYENDGVLWGIIVVGLLGFWAIPRIELHLASRPCPRCGEKVAIGELDCPYCDFDFRSIGNPPTS